MKPPCRHQNILVITMWPTSNKSVTRHIVNCCIGPCWVQLLTMVIYLTSCLCNMIWLGFIYESDMYMIGVCIIWELDSGICWPSPSNQSYRQIEGYVDDHQVAKWREGVIGQHTSYKTLIRVLSTMHPNANITKSGTLDIMCMYNFRVWYD